MRISRVAAVVVAASLSCLGTTLVGTADAAHVSCGQTIVASTTFDADVGPCDEGIVIGADNIVVDLGGHTLSGPSDWRLNLPGIDTDGHSGVVIRNGTVTGFSAGVAINAGSRNTVTNIVARDNIGSLDDSGDYGDGIVVFFSHNNRITGNRAIHNGTYDGIGIISGRNNLVENNVVVDNNIGQTDGKSPEPILMRDVGISVLSLFPGADATDNVVRRNQVLRNGSDGIRLARFSHRNTVQGNTVSQNGLTQVPNFFDFRGDGIGVLSSQNTVVGNNVSGNGDDGISVVASNDATGTTVNGRNNIIRRNASVRNNRGGDPAPAFDLRDTNTTPPCDANVWSANVYVTFNQPCVTAP